MKFLSAIVLSLGVMIAQAQTQWTIDQAHSNIKFTAQHMAIAEVEGEFRDFSATVTSTAQDFAGSEVTFTAQVGSIETRNDRRDGHLKSDDFFNAEKYPEIRFEGMLKKKGKEYMLVGDLTIRDITKSVDFPAQYFGQIESKNGMKAGFKVTGKINRFDYNLEWDNALQNGTLVVGEEITITCNVELNEVST